MQLIQECSVKLSRCDLDCKESAARTDKSILAAFQQPAVAAVQRVQVSGEVPVMVIKKEYDTENAVTTNWPRAGLVHLQEKDSVSDFGLLVEKKDDLVMKTEDEADDLTVKQELDIGPTVLQPKTTLHLFPPPLVPLKTRAPDPRPSTSSPDNAAPAPLILEDGRRKKIYEENKFSDKWIRQRELAKARMRKYRKRKRSALKQLESMVQNESKVDEFKKRQIEEEHDQRRRELARERSRRYRQKKRLDALKSIEGQEYLSLSCKEQKRPMEVIVKSGSLAENVLMADEIKEIKKRQMEEENNQHRRKLARERSKRYREKKRLCSEIL